MKDMTLEGRVRSALRILGRELGKRKEEAERARKEQQKFEDFTRLAVHFVVEMGAVRDVKEAVREVNGGGVRGPLEYSETSRTIRTIRRAGVSASAPSTGLPEVDEALRDLAQQGDGAPEGEG